jgi:hypothetical protein
MTCQRVELVQEDAMLKNDAFYLVEIFYRGHAMGYQSRSMQGSEMVNKCRACL